MPSQSLFIVLINPLILPTPTAIRIIPSRTLDNIRDPAPDALALVLVFAELGFAVLDLDVWGLKVHVWNWTLALIAEAEGAYWGAVAAEERFCFCEGFWRGCYCGCVAEEGVHVF